MSPFMPPEDWYQRIHKRLLAEDATASAELVETIMDELTEKLGGRYPNQRGSDLIADAITEALMGYIKNPAQYKPEKMGLFSYLLMSANGDMLNSLAKVRRRKEIFFEDVELEAADGKEFVEAVAVGPETRIHAQRLRKEIYELFDDPKDRDIASLIIEGERSTEAFAEIIGIKDMSDDEKRREVKRHKDRIKKRLERYGEKISERER